MFFSSPDVSLPSWAEWRMKRSRVGGNGPGRAGDMIGPSFRAGMREAGRLCSLHMGLPR